jgi:hypothetical protein
MIDRPGIGSNVLGGRDGISPRLPHWSELR